MSMATNLLLMRSRTPSATVRAANSKGDVTIKKQSESILHALGTLLNLENSLTKDENDCCIVNCEGQVLSLIPDIGKKHFIVSAYVGNLPGYVQSGLLERLLAANLYWEIGGTLSLEPATRSLLLLDTIPLHDLSAEQLLTRMKEFRKCIHSCKQRITKILRGKYDHDSL